RLEHELTTEGLAGVVVDRAVPAVGREELEIDHRRGRVVEPETGEEHRLVELEEQAPGVEEVQLRIGDFRAERLVPLAEVEGDLVGRLQRGVRLANVLQAEGGVADAGAVAAGRVVERRFGTEAKADGAADGIRGIARVDADLVE